MVSTVYSNVASTRQFAVSITVLAPGIFFKHRQNVLHRFHLILRQLMGYSLPERCPNIWILLETKRYLKKQKIKNKARVEKIGFLGTMSINTSSGIVSDYLFHDN